MTEWRQVALGDVVDIFDHKRVPLSSAQRSARQGPYPYYGAQGVIDSIDEFIFDGRFILVPEDGENLRSRKLPVAYFAEGQFWVNNHAHIIKGKSNVANDRFIQSSLQALDLGPYVTGAAQPKLSQSNLKRVTLRLPSLAYQEIVARILNALDDLIRNNQRRVEVLEEMARRIYREWFVYYRYPGYEDATSVDSSLGPIPEGWNATRLGDVASLVRGRSYRKHELVEAGGRPFINLKCMMRGGGFRRDGLKRYEGEWKDEQLVSRGDIVLAVTDLTQGREILARATLVPRLSEGPGVISLDVARIVADDPSDRLWIFAALRWSNFADRVKEYANGSTVLHLSPSHVTDGLLMWPDSNRRRAYVKTVESMIGMIDELNDASVNLAKLRDELLPKLVTGQVDVSSLDLDGLVESATA